MNKPFENEMGHTVTVLKNLQAEAQDQKSLGKHYEDKKHVEMQNKLIMSNADMKVDKWLSSYRP